MKFSAIVLAVLLSTHNAHAQSRVEPVGAVFASLLATAAIGFAVVMLGPLSRQDSSAAYLGYGEIALAGTFLGAGIACSIPRADRATVRVAANGFIIRW